jgi:hypothetical protein
MSVLQRTSRGRFVRRGATNQLLFQPASRARPAALRFARGKPHPANRLVVPAPAKVALGATFAASISFTNTSMN